MFDHRSSVTELNARWKLFKQFITTKNNNFFNENKGLKNRRKEVFF